MITASSPQRLLHCPLEPYKMRYTEFLETWENSAFSSDGWTVQSVKPKTESALLDIRSGSVLDSVNRPVWAMDQVRMLLTETGSRQLGKIWFSDFFHPGLEALPYSRQRFQAYSFLWAQTFDLFDFTRPMFPWMRPWEIMAFDIYSRVFVASTGLHDLICSALPHVSDRLDIVGLPFNSEHVAKQLGSRSDEYDVVYSSRWDAEKCPQFFMQLVKSRRDLKFVVCTGWDTLRGSMSAAIQDAIAYSSQPNSNLVVLTGLSKEEYYAVLFNTKVQFNCAMQDWVSFTLLEALTFGCRPLYPAHRSFPETLNYQVPFLYRPFDLGDALAHLDDLLSGKHDSLSRELGRAVLDYHNGTLGRISNTIKQ